MVGLTDRETAEMLYERARALPPEARSAFLAEACASDPHLEAELRSLLAHAEPAEAFFERLAEAVVSPTLGHRVGRYTLLGSLGRGGMGTVYRARDTRLGRDVALKFLPPYLSAQPEAQERLLVEARAAAALEHPNVCTIHEIGETDEGCPFIAMACYEGETLKERLGRGSLPLADTVAIAVQIARGLAAAHAHGIVHRDVKPGNIMLCADGTVRLLDFGLAKLTDVTLTGPGVRPGTVAYMSPEQARGDPMDPRTDLWSLGVVLYEMLTGVRPFRGGNDRAVIQAMLHEDPEPVSKLRPETPAALAGIVERLLCKAPTDRLGSADDLVAELVCVSSVPRAPRLSIEVPAQGRPPSLNRTGTILGGAVLLSLLLWLAGPYHRGDVRGRGLGSPPPAAGEVPPGIAVLPFAVQDSALADLREGLVDLLSIDLSGVTGLRPIDGRTVLARWREQVAGSQMPDLATALDVAHRADARYAVVGSVIASGTDLLLTAGVHEVESRRVLGTSRIRGPADSIFALVDRLTLETLRLILRGEARELPRVDLARASTSSLPALKAYLEGEVLLRGSHFQRAIEAYSRAVEADSTFALARFRLGLARQWSWQPIATGAPNPLVTDLGPFTDRLPPHEAALVRANLRTGRDTRGGRELLEQEVRRYPDDAETWYQLGDLYFHSGAQALVSPEAADRAFARAIELDSSFTLPYIHLIDRAINAGDSAGTAGLLETYTRLAPESPFVGWYRLMLGLAFGDSATRAGAWVALDTLGTPDLFRLALSLQGPGCCWRQSREVLRRARQRRDLRPLVTRFLFWASVSQGKAREALGWLDDPFMPEEFKGQALYVLHDLGVAVPSARLNSALRLGPGDRSDAFQLFYAGAYAAERARWQDLRVSLSRLQTLAGRLRAAGDSTDADFMEAANQGLEGCGWWRRGKSVAALPLLEHSQHRAIGDGDREVVNLHLRWWLGRLLLEMGRPRDALPYFESVSQAFPVAFPRAEYDRGRIHEQFGELDRARDAYAHFVAAWEDADPELQPVVEEARAAIQRLAAASPK